MVEEVYLHFYSFTEEQVVKICEKDLNGEISNVYSMLIQKGISSILLRKESQKRKGLAVHSKQHKNSLDNSEKVILKDLKVIKG
ncbi:hypothetical protein DI495_04320 [Streptococcus dysgalactiae subsp. equisimilis]|uniref:hypothetical protein n=1 Tax=Streptococcus dysgalactiae TaxID=1334 RepID=UPI000D7732EB|nr:hypothetical protein [Streptococcus dysgalactiae]PXX83538.1 hypothetical protein DI495_04320 [Streptococcus dysgalactiae subsp. equisimilis]